MNDNSDFEINYWGNAPDYHQSSEKPRSFKSKILIVLCFILILGITPTFIFGLNKIQTNKSTQISTTAVLKSATAKPAIKVKIPTPTPKVSDEVLKGDSYWRLSKRNCGSGKYYLSIKDQNENKPLHQGDLVKIACEL